MLPWQGRIRGPMTFFSINQSVYLEWLISNRPNTWKLWMRARCGPLLAGRWRTGMYCKDDRSVQCRASNLDRRRTHVVAHIRLIYVGPLGANQARIARLIWTEGRGINGGAPCSSPTSIDPFPPLPSLVDRPSVPSSFLRSFPSLRSLFHSLPSLPFPFHFL